MKKYIALLRGINISGKNKVSMPLLKIAFEEIDFHDVTTYINSGNVVFSSDIEDKEELMNKCQSVIRDKFLLDIPVKVVSAEELLDTLNHSPEWWDIDKEDVNYGIFLIEPISIEEVFSAVGDIKPEYETIAYYGNVIFWTAPLKTFSKARWSKIASSSVNNNVTIRNANTLKKLLLLTEK